LYEGAEAEAESDEEDEEPGVYTANCFRSIGPRKCIETSSSRGERLPEYPYAELLQVPEVESIFVILL
jgi:hypothetical protein